MRLHDGLPHLIADAADSIKESPNKLIQAMCSFHRHATVCIDTEASDFEHILKRSSKIFM